MDEQLVVQIASRLFSVSIPVLLHYQFLSIELKKGAYEPAKRVNILISRNVVQE